MKKLTIIIALFCFAFIYQAFGQQDVQNANAPKLLPMEKIETPKTPKKSYDKTATTTKNNAPALNTLGTTTNEKPKELPAEKEKSNTPTLSNQNQIVEPKKDKE